VFRLGCKSYGQLPRAHDIIIIIAMMSSCVLVATGNNSHKRIKLH